MEDARVAVLNSNDPEMQLAWSQDALAHVEVAMQNDLRLPESQPSRSMTPRIEHQLRVDAVNIVNFLADQHHPRAEFMRGMWWEFGKFGFRMDKKEAFRCYHRAAQAGYARAEYRMGMQYETSNEVEKALRHYQLGVQAHDSASNYRLAMMTLLGQQGQRQDYFRGVQMIKFSADTADENTPQGAYVFGMLKARELAQVSIPEQCLPLDTAGALYYIEKAAYLGFAKAQTRIGAAYELGELGCRFDPLLSLHYNNLAARQGEADAEMAISKWFLCGYEEVFPKSEKMAFQYAQRAAQSGLATAEFAMGYFYEIGIHVPIDIKEARRWYVKAAEHGNGDAAGRVEGIGRSKTLSRKDHDRIAVAKINSGRPSQRRSSGRPLSSTSGSVAQSEVNPQRLVSPRGSSFPGPNSNIPIQNPSIPGQYSTMPVQYSSPPSSSTPNSGATNPSMSPTLGMPEPKSTFQSYGAPRPLSATSPGGYSIQGQDRPHSASFGPIPGPIQGHGVGGFGNLGGPGHAQGTSLDGRHPSASSAPATLDALPTMQHMPAVDIGFSAPPDPLGADRPKRSQYGDNPSRQYGPNPAQRTARKPVGQSSHGGRSNAISLTDPGMSRPSRNSSMPPSRSGALSHSAGASPGPTFASSQPKPTKGPATFEEMGVPQTKKEGDCVSLPRCRSSLIF